MSPTDLTGLSALQLASLLAIAFVAGLARGFSGFGGALIFVPVASAIIGPRSAAPLLLLIDIVATLGLIPQAWRRADRIEVGTMTLGALVGIPCGTLVLARFDALTIRWSIVLIVALLLVLLISGWRYRGRPRASLTAAVGCLSGFGSGAAQIGGPPVVAYWLGGPVPSATIRANVILYFAASNVLAAHQLPCRPPDHRIDRPSRDRGGTRLWLWPLGRREAFREGRRDHVPPHLLRPHRRCRDPGAAPPRRSPALDHDAVSSNRANGMNVIAFNIIEHDVIQNPCRLFGIMR